MAAAADSDAFLTAGLATLGIEVDEIEMAVISATHELYWPPIAQFLDIDLSAVEPEPNADMSRAPEGS
jgi:hypothetical protein